MSLDVPDAANLKSCFFDSVLQHIISKVREHGIIANYINPSAPFSMNSRASLRTMQTSVEVSGTSGPVSVIIKTFPQRATQMLNDLHSESQQDSCNRYGSVGPHGDGHL